MKIFFANLMWFCSSIAGYLAFKFSLKDIKSVQTKKLLKILKKNSNTVFGKKHQFINIKSYIDYMFVPLSEYEDYTSYIDQIKKGENDILTNENIQTFVPTSGSSSATKLIPYTRSLKKEFQACINPWIASLYLTYPSLLLGRHFWSITPNTAYFPDSSSKIRIGFDDDVEYLGIAMRFLTNILFVIPPVVTKITDQNAFKYITLLFLLREKNLRIISVWHPSFLTLLIKDISKYFDSIINDIETGNINENVQINKEIRNKINKYLIPNHKRAAQIRTIDLNIKKFPSLIWPNLKVISLWAEGQSTSWIKELSDYFPKTIFQGKGLIATEGIISFPFGKNIGNVCSIRSHYFEFIEKDTNNIKPIWEIEKNKEYSIILTTSGGLYRYRLHDIVKVVGFLKEVPIFKFITRDNIVSDMVGEKLNLSHVEKTIKEIQNNLNINFEFSMLAPYKNETLIGYTLYLKHSNHNMLDYKKIADHLLIGLSQNYHYHHASKNLQLGPVKIFNINDNAFEKYRAFFLNKGKKMGDIKFFQLSLHTAWDSVFNGKYEVY